MNYRLIPESDPMRHSLHLALLTLCLLPITGWADDKPDPLEARKAAALENWDKIDGGQVVMENTAHFLLVAPKAMSEKLKEPGELFEKLYEQVVKALYQPKDTPFKGHVTVYLLEKPDQVDKFIRRIEKRRPLGQEHGCFGASDDKLHVAASPPREKGDPPVDVQAAQQIASMMLQRKAGVSTILPYWLVNGFGRATYYRVFPDTMIVKNERGLTANLVRTKKRTAQDVWNATLDGEESVLMNPALADFLAYGPLRMKFLGLIDGFKPGENEDKKTMEQALTSIDVKVDALAKTFGKWAVLPN
jgi:hypothetical protein